MDNENEQLMLRALSVLLWRELQRDRDMPIDLTTRGLHCDLLREIRAAVKERT